jgi:uncharacterized protein (TIGR00730 family)
MAEQSLVCVYCGSSARVIDVYKSAATELGQRLAAAGVGLVYGGGRIGLMGLVADAAAAGGVPVVGVIPHFLDKLEVANPNCTELIRTDTMHARKTVMAERADGFVVLPGGFGTLDEAFEILTWKQLGLHSKPIVFVNVNGYWDPLLALVDRLVDSAFARPENRKLFTVVEGVADVLPALAASPEPTGDVQAKWM